MLQASKTFIHCKFYYWFVTRVVEKFFFFNNLTFYHFLFLGSWSPLRTYAILPSHLLQSVTANDLGYRTSGLPMFRYSEWNLKTHLTQASQPRVLREILWVPKETLVFFRVHFWDLYNNFLLITEHVSK